MKPFFVFLFSKQWLLLRSSYLNNHILDLALSVRLYPRRSASAERELGLFVVRGYPHPWLPMSFEFGPVSCIGLFRAAESLGICTTLKCSQKKRYSEPGRAVHAGMCAGFLRAPSPAEASSRSP